MKKVLSMLLVTCAVTMYASENPSLANLLQRIEQKFQDENEVCQNEYQKKCDITETVIPIFYNLGEYIKVTVPIIIDKYMEFQDVAIAYGKSNPEILESGKLQLPEEPLTKDYLEKLYIIGMKVLFSSEKDYEDLRALSFEQEAKQSILWDIDEDYEDSIVDQAEKAIKESVLDKYEFIVKNSSDPLLSEFLYPQIQIVKEDPSSWCVARLVIYNEERLGAILEGEFIPENPIDEKVLSLVEELKLHSKNFSKSQKLAMNAYLHNFSVK